MMQVVVADEASGEANDDVGGWRGVLVCETAVTGHE
jgi:hypothetical protein